nr:reverse transcriptase domain-containing protein [Tanacetum cinerariifolium]
EPLVQSPNRTGDGTDASLLYKPCVTGSGTKLLTHGKAGTITGLCSKKASKIFSSTSYRGASVAETQEEPWTLFTDGSSCVDGSSAGLILTNSDGVEFTYALRFARECRASRAQDNKNRESTKKNVHVKTTNSTALVSCDGLRGYDWSDQVEEGPNYALMAYSTSSSGLRTSKIQTITYKIGLDSVEASLLVYKKNEYVYEKDIKLLKREIYLKDIAISELRRKLELANKQKDEIQLTVEIFENSSKSLSKLLDSQIADKCKAGLGYNVVPPPYTGNFLPPKPNLSGLEEFVNESIVSEPTVKKPVVETSEAKASTDKPKDVRKNFGPLLVKDWISDSEDEAKSGPKITKKTVKPSFAKIKFVKSKEQVKTPMKTTVKQVEKPRQNTHRPRGNQRN